MMFAPGTGHAGAGPRIVLCSCGRALVTAVRSGLGSPDVDVVSCRPQVAVLEEVIRLHPAVLVYELRATRLSDHAILQLLKRVAPEVRLVLIGASSLATERAFRELRPVYYAIRPADGDEIIEVVRAALGERAQRGA
jgi:ActR/RegA family two-component response regulator